MHESVRAEHKLLRAFFSEAAPPSITEDHITIAFPVTASFNKRKAEEPDNRKILLRRCGAHRPSLHVSVRAARGPPAEGGGDRQAPSEEEIMARLMSELDAEELTRAA